MRVHLGSLRNMIFALLSSLVVGILLFYLVPFPITPKTNLILSVVFYGGFLVMFRRYVEYAFSRNFKQTIAFLGETPLARELANEISAHAYLGYRIVGIFTDIREVTEQAPDLIIINQALTTNDLECLSNTSSEIMNVREAYQNILNRLPVDLVDDALALSMIEKTDSLAYNFLRRVLDILVSLMILVLTLPLTLVAGLLIFIEDRGPVFYRHTRTGLQRQPFSILKLRTMRVDAEIEGVQWARPRDNRVTFVGRVLRILHIDEIPQMINVLVGDITLVGPRPERPEFVAILEKEIPYYFLRHNIRPGFTGWAQIKFRYARSVMDSQKKFEYDLYYLKNRNLFMDLGIIAKTIQIIFTH